VHPAVIDLDVPPPVAPSRPRRGGPGRTLLAGVLVGGLAAAVLTGPGDRTSPASPAAAAGAVSPSAPAAVGSFAGRLPGSDLRLHVTADAAGDVVAYATDGRGVAVWFAGRRTGDRLDLAAGPDRLVADVGPVPVAVALTVARRTHRATLPRVRRGGLFAARTRAGVAGWVVDDDGAVTGKARRPGSAVRVDRLTPKWATLTPAVHALLDPPPAATDPPAPAATGPPTPAATDRPAPAARRAPPGSRR
jgi:hypothetical protein